jgi:phosphotransferase system  glucose/maltose/N-acetylglucosamine-specific IIC component
MGYDSMELRKKNFILIILILFFSGISLNFAEENISVNISINQSLSEKIVNESVQNIQNKTLSIFKEVKSIEYNYKLQDKTDYGKIYKTTNGFDVSIVSKNKNSSIALAYSPKCFIIYDEVFLKVYGNSNLTLLVSVNNKTLKDYGITKNYEMYKFEFNDEVKKIRFRILDNLNNGSTVFDTGELTVIHKNYIDWHEEQKKEYTTVEVGTLILSKMVYFVSGGVLALVLAVILARREKKKKESEILAGWQ